MINKNQKCNWILNRKKIKEESDRLLIEKNNLINKEY